MNVDIINESLKPIRESIKKQQEIITSVLSPHIKATKFLAEYFHYHRLVPPPVYDFLLLVQVDRDDAEEKDKIYTIYTRKSKGGRFENPSFKVTQEMFMSIDTVLRNSKSSVIVEDRYISFNNETGELRIWGYSTYMKKNSRRYLLCKHMFKRKKKNYYWELEDLVYALKLTYDKDRKKDSHNIINGLIRRLNEDISRSIGIDRFIVYEAGAYRVNASNMP